MAEWDYSAVGWYFLTMCTRSHSLFFGEVIEGEARRSVLGEMAHRYWLDIPNHFSQVSLDEFIIMPNHVHGIIVINSPEIYDDFVETQHAASLQTHNATFLQPTHAASLQLPKPDSISAIVRSYKSAVTRWAGMNGYLEFGWQARFYDHIIRNEKSLERIRLYISGNPIKWSEDDYYSLLVTV